MFRLQSFGAGFLLGFGAGFISRDLLSNENSYVRPFVKGAMKTGTSAWNKGLEVVSTLVETMEDIMAEIRAEAKQPMESKAEASDPLRKKTVGAKI